MNKTPAAQPHPPPSRQAHERRRTIAGPHSAHSRTAASTDRPSRQTRRTRCRAAGTGDPGNSDDKHPGNASSRNKRSETPCAVGSPSAQTRTFNWRISASSVVIAGSECTTSRPLRGGLEGGQFGPNVLPIVWSQILPCHGAVGGALDGRAAVSRDALLAHGPVGNYGRGNAHGPRDSEGSPALTFHPFIKFHQCIISHGVSVCQ